MWSGSHTTPVTTRLRGLSWLMNPGERSRRGGHGRRSAVAEWRKRYRHMTAAQFQILGPVRVLNGASELDIGGRQQRLMLAALLARAGSAVSVTELIDAIWDEDPPTSAVNVVHRYIGVLRRRIEPDLPVRATGRYLIRQASGYQLRVTTETFDLLR